MLVFGTEMHIITFIFVIIEIVILFYLLVFRMARPDDKATVLNIALITLLLLYNIAGGLFPDPKLPGSFFWQNAVAYAMGFLTPSFFAYYVYHSFGLTRMKFHVYKGAFFFLIVPYFIFLMVFAVSGDLGFAQNMLALPVLYAAWLISSIFQAIKYKYQGDFSSKESKQEVAILFLSLSPWICLPVIDYFQIGQAVEATITNIGFLLLFGLQVNRNIRQIRIEHEKLLRSEQQLRNWNINLQQEVKRRTIQLENANEQKTNNFINLVHETKTPLTLIKNYLDEYIGKHGSAEELEVIKGGVDKLTNDVINLFDIERFSKGIGVYKHRQVSDFSAILKSNLPLFQQYCRKQSIKCDTSIRDGLFVKADPNAINRIINNLIENAVKFTGQGGAISISLRQDKSNIIFSVKDNGIGIPSELQRKIFEPYYQIGHKHTSLQGMGLGLPIVKKVVESLNGEIRVESNPAKHKGAEVMISFKAHELGEQEVPVDGSQVPVWSGYQLIDFEISDSEYVASRQSILLVEDSKAMIHFLFRKLNGRYNVFCAVNGVQALKKLHSMQVLPDLVISDIMMDKMDGFAFVKVVSEQEGLSHIPIIFLTAKSTPTDRLQGLKLGAIDFISKPFSFEELSHKIETVLDNLSRQQKAILASSILSLKAMRLQDNGKEPAIAASKVEENCRTLNLTTRESEIVKYVIKGKTSRAIAEKLFISERTVTKHIQHIFEKAGVSNKIELIHKLTK